MRINGKVTQTSCSKHSIAACSSVQFLWSDASRIIRRTRTRERGSKTEATFPESTRWELTSEWFCKWRFAFRSQAMTYRNCILWASQQRELSRSMARVTDMNRADISRIEKPPYDWKKCREKTEQMLLGRSLLGLLIEQGCPGRSKCDMNVC